MDELLLLAGTYLLNLPFGYWRKMAKKMSLEWFAAIHLPVPIIFVARILSGIPLAHVPLFVIAFFLGQFSGSRIANSWGRKYRISKCLIVDLVKIVNSKLRD